MLSSVDAPIVIAAFIRVGEIILLISSPQRISMEAIAIASAKGLGCFLTYDARLD